MQRVKRRIFSGVVCEQEVFNISDRLTDITKAEPRPRFKTEEEREPVSYTHLDVYKRQEEALPLFTKSLNADTRESLTKTSVLFTAPILHRRQHLKTLGAGAKDAPQISNERKAIQYENEEDRKSRRIANDRICDRWNDKRKHLY